MKSTPNSRSSSKNRVTNGRVSTESNRSSHRSEESLGAEEVGKSKKELKQQSVYLLILKQIAERKKTFHRLFLLPPELRCMIYSKLPLADRVMAAKACPEMATYFRNNRLKLNVKMMLEEESGKVYIKVKYDYVDDRYSLCVDYVEMYQIPQELVASVERDLASSRSSECEMFRPSVERKPVENQRVRYFLGTTRDLQVVFDTLALIQVQHFALRTAPFGGFVDLVQPAGLYTEPVELVVALNLQENIPFERDDPEFVVDHWERWLDYLHPYRLSIWSNLEEEEEDIDIYVPKELYDLPAVHQVKSLYQDFCNGDINYRQLTNMKATSISLYRTRSQWLTAADLLHFYQVKLQAWILKPDTKFHYRFGSFENPPNPPYLDFRKLLKDVREQVESPDFRVYPNHDVHALGRDLAEEKCLTIRHVKSGRCVSIKNGSFWSGDPDYFYCFLKHVWPEKHGFDF